MDRVIFAYMSEDKKVFRLGELFCGPGGIGYAAHRSKVGGYRIKTVWANDNDESTCETYSHNLGNAGAVKVINQDVRTLNIDELPLIDALAFGFPCNDFSIVGEQKGTDGEYGPLYSYGVKAIKRFKPRWFVAENVGGLSNANEGGAFKKILSELHMEGYDLVPHLYKFEKYGVPQARHRIIIVGIRSGEGLLYRVPEPTHQIPVTCQFAIENPPIEKTAFNNELTRQSHNVVERLKFIKPGENAFTADIPEELRLNVKGAKISQIYKRLDPNKPAYTVTGSGGGGTHVYHWKDHRALTNRERARLQSFPDSFEFLGSKESVRRQIGMAVPPLGMKVIFESILKTFSGVKYESVPSSFEPLFHSSDRELSNHNHNHAQQRLLDERKDYVT